MLKKFFTVILVIICSIFIVNFASARNYKVTSIGKGTPLNISNSGLVVGQYSNGGDNFVWKDGILTNLTNEYGLILDVSNNGRVVFQQLVDWKDGVYTDYRNLFPENTTGHEPMSINDTNIAGIWKTNNQLYRGWFSVVAPILPGVDSQFVEGTNSFFINKTLTNKHNDIAIEYSINGSNTNPKYIQCGEFNISHDYILELLTDSSLFIREIFIDWKTDYVVNYLVNNELIEASSLSTYAKVRSGNGNYQAVGVSSDNKDGLRVWLCCDIDNTYATLWENTLEYSTDLKLTPLNLNDYISDSTWILKTAQGINDFGQIVGMGLHNGVKEAYLLTPIPDNYQQNIFKLMIRDEKTRIITNGILTIPENLDLIDGKLIDVEFTIRYKRLKTDGSDLVVSYDDIQEVIVNNQNSINIE